MDRPPTATRKPPSRWTRRRAGSGMTRLRRRGGKPRSGGGEPLDGMGPAPLSPVAARPGNGRVTLASYGRPGRAVSWATLPRSPAPGLDFDERVRAPGRGRARSRFARQEKDRPVDETRFDALARALATP